MDSGIIAAIDERLAVVAGVHEHSAKRISALVEPRFIALEALGLAMLPRLRPRERSMLIAAPLMAALGGHALKLLFPRERPDKTRFTPTGGQSFPSTHAANSMALLLAAARVTRAHGAGYWVYLAASGLGAVIGVARIRAAAHWPTDVLAGICLGTAAAGCAAAIADRA
ncbi:MAG TPA: phosphatase PAP2 family protein [Polyangiaceae bacterium]|jgi:undecaprenyl-diphosphatase|nr:phosphatase PAP2 family protein [Polyangiaceae bacterium]